MILCKSCGFGVLDTMRYALKSNACPSCGKTLFGDKHVQEMSAISGRIRSQAFSQALSDDIVFDISLFILNNYLDPIASDEAGESERESSEPQVDSNQEASNEEEGSLELIRDEIRAEAMSGLSQEEEESEDMRLSRLKRMAKMSKGLNKTGPSVRRVTT